MAHVLHKQAICTIVEGATVWSSLKSRGVTSPGAPAHHILSVTIHKTQTSTIQPGLKLTKTHIQKQQFYKTVPFVRPLSSSRVVHHLFTSSGSALDFSILPQHHVLKPNSADCLFKHVLCTYSGNRLQCFCSLWKKLCFVARGGSEIKYILSAATAEIWLFKGKKDFSKNKSLSPSLRKWFQNVHY